EGKSATADLPHPASGRSTSGFRSDTGPASRAAAAVARVGADANQRPEARAPVHGGADPAVGYTRLQYMAVPTLPLDTPVFSIECWVRPILPGCLLSYGPATSEGPGLTLEALEGGVVRLRLVTSNHSALLDLKSDATDVLDGSWHHVAVARSLLGATLYID